MALHSKHGASPSSVITMQVLMLWCILKAWHSKSSFVFLLCIWTCQCSGVGVVEYRGSTGAVWDILILKLAHHHPQCPVQWCRNWRVCMGFLCCRVWKQRCWTYKWVWLCTNIVLFLDSKIWFHTISLVKNTLHVFPNRWEMSHKTSSGLDLA